MGKSKYTSTDSSKSTDSNETSSDESSDAVTEVQRMKNTKKKRILEFSGLTKVQVILISLVFLLKRLLLWELHLTMMEPRCLS